MRLIGMCAGRWHHTAIIDVYQVDSIISLMMICDLVHLYGALELDQARFYVRSENLEISAF